MNEQFFFADISPNEIYIVEQSNIIEEEDGEYVMIYGDKRYINKPPLLVNL